MKNQAAPFCSAQLPEISPGPDKPGYRKTQVKVKMASARMLWNLETVIFSHHLLLFDKLLHDLCVYDVMRKCKMNILLAFTNLTREVTEVLF